MTERTTSRGSVAEIKAAGGAKPRVGRDPVNQPMINNWVEAHRATPTRSTSTRPRPALPGIRELSRHRR